MDRKKELEKKIIDKINAIARDGEIDVKKLRRFHERFHDAVEEPLRIAAIRFEEREEHKEAAETYGMIGNRKKEAREYEKAGELEKAAMIYGELGEEELAVDIYLDLMEKASKNTEKWSCKRDILNLLNTAAPLLKKMTGRARLNAIIEKLEEQELEEVVAEIHLALEDEDKAIEVMDRSLEKNRGGCEFLEFYTKVGRYDRIRKLAEEAGGWSQTRIMMIVRTLRDWDTVNVDETQRIVERDTLEVLKDDRIRGRLLETMGVEPAEEVKRLAEMFGEMLYECAKNLVVRGVERKTDEWYYTHRQHPDSTFAQWKKDENYRYEAERGRACGAYREEYDKLMKKALYFFLEAGNEERAQDAYNKGYGGNKKIPPEIYEEAGMHKKTAEEYETRGEYMKAIYAYAKLGLKSDLQRVARLFEEKEEWVNAGWAYEKAGLDEKALIMYLKAHEGNLYYAYSERAAEIYERLGRIENAAEICFETGEVYELRAEEEKRWTRPAIDLYKKAMEYYGKFETRDMEKEGEIREKIVILLISIGEMEEAEKIWNEK